MSIIYQSKRIVIREFLAAEQSIFCSFFDDEDVMQYLPRLQKTEYKNLFDAALNDYSLGPFGRWGIFETVNGNFIGNCLLRPFLEIPGQIEIGYSLSKLFWGRGIATEVAKALTAYGFAKTNTTEIVALTDFKNLGSQNVLKKSGFVQLENIIRRGVELNYFLIKRD